MSTDQSFVLSETGLQKALKLLESCGAPKATPVGLPSMLPEAGIGEIAALEGLAPYVLGRAAYLDSESAFAHMDPPTPWITWAVALWNARLNQNLLHPETAPFGREAEESVVSWLAPFFGMDGGHMTSGSSVANLTAIWAARDLKGVKRVVASSASHLSVRKAAKILGLDYVEVAVDGRQRLDPAALPRVLSNACLILTAGTTSVGAVDPLCLCGSAAWTHVDAAWAGPLRLSAKRSAILSGIEHADSVSVSAHKLLFQPKESGFVFFHDTDAAHAAISFGGAYLAAPVIGVQGSRAAIAAPLIATLLAWGREGLAARIERCMTRAEALSDFIATAPKLELFSPGGTGVTVFRPRSGRSAELREALPAGMTSITTINGESWLRCVSANPNANVALMSQKLEQQSRNL